MFLLRFLELVLGVLFIILLVTQVAVPLLLNRPTFWAFRKKSGQKQVEDLKGALSEKELTEEAKALKAKLNRKGSGK